MKTHSLHWRMPQSTMRSLGRIGLFAAIAAVFSLWLVLAQSALAASSVEQFDQCRNDDGSGGTLGQCDWTNGNAGPLSFWWEGDSVPQRLHLTGLSAGTNTLVMDYATTKGGKVAFDYLTSYDFSEDWIDQTELCRGVAYPGCATATPNAFTIPVDPNITVKGVVQPSDQQMLMFGGTITGMTYDGANYAFVGDTKRQVTVTFTVPAGCSGNCEVFLTWGAHIATEVDWGVGNSAVIISGSPYHMRVTELNGVTTGNRDNQTQVSNSPTSAGSITIIKVATPADGTDFNFSLSGGTTNITFTLDNDADATLSDRVTYPGLAPGIYSLNELNIPSGWEMDSISCFSKESSSTFTYDQNNKKVAINLRMGRHIPDEVTCTFYNSPVTVIVPGIAVVKTASPGDVVAPGQNVTFRVDVSNTGDGALTLNSLIDDIHGDITTTTGPGMVSTTCSVPQTIAEGGHYKCSFVATVSGQVGDTHINTVTATATGQNSATVSDSDDAEVHILDTPAIAVLKTATPTTVPAPGAVVTFTVAISNTGGGVVTINSLTDDIYGDITTADHHGIIATTCSTPQPIVPADGYLCEFSAMVSGTAGSTHKNTVTAVGTGFDGREVSDDDDASVAIIAAPSISVLKSATPTTVPAPGAEVAFTVVVSNTGGGSVTLNSLTDDIYGNIASAGNTAIESTTCAVPQTIAEGGGYSCSFSAMVSGTAGSSHKNTVTAVGTGFDGREVSDDDDASVAIVGGEPLKPSIKVSKDASKAQVVAPGQDVTFTVLVENTGEGSIHINSLTDTIYGNIASAGNTAIKSTTCTVPQTIAVSGSYSCTFVATVNGQTGAIHTNVVTASGTAEDDSVVTDDDDATVTIVAPPAIKVLKTPGTSVVVAPGSNVTFAVVVSNIGNGSVTISSLLDNKFGNIAGAGNASIVSTTCTVPRTIAQGGNYNCAFTAFVGGLAGSTHVNVVTAAGTGINSIPVSASDDATVAVVGGQGESACPADSGVLYTTSILGVGMGDTTRARSNVQLKVPNNTAVVSLYGQLVAKETVAYNGYARFTGSDRTIFNDKTMESPAHRENAEFWFGQQLTPTNLPWWKASLMKGTKKPFQPRAFLLYPAYRQTEEYWNYFDVLENSSKNFVYWEWIPTQTYEILLPAPLPEARQITVQVALVDNDNDARPVQLNITAGSATFNTAPTSSSDQLGLLNIITAKLNAPVGTDKVIITLTSPTGTGDSVSMVGVVANYLCVVEP